MLQRIRQATACWLYEEWQMLEASVWIYTFSHLLF